MPHRRPRPSGLLALAAGLLAGTASAQVFTEFSLPNPYSAPHGICAGPDGALWFTEYLGNRIGRITTDGAITEFSIPTPVADPVSIVAGPDGNLWFTEAAGNAIGRITPFGVITEFALPSPNSGPSGIAAGPDGALWFTEGVGYRIGRITTSGEIIEFPLAAFTTPRGIATGPDGNLWFTMAFSFPPGNRIGRLTPAGGHLTEFEIPTPAAQPSDIVVGPDGMLWFTEFGGNAVGRVEPDGTITEFRLPASSSEPQGITTGPDGAVWCVENGSRISVTGPPVLDGWPNSLARIRPDGQTTEFVIPTRNSGPSDITVGPDGNLWFTESAGNKIGRLTLAPAPREKPRERGGPRTVPFRPTD